jgi:putative solute:sodium symporter small subunit
MTISTSTAGPGDYDAPTEEGGGVPSAEGSNAEASSEETSAAEGAYWRENIRLLVSLMTIWFVSSFGAGILFRDFLDQFMLGGYPLGFWFAQQGAIYIFIALICFYVVRMKQIERKYDLDD